MQDEKTFKKRANLGYRAIAFDRDAGVVHSYPYIWSDEKIKEEAKGKELYMSLDDFNK